ncbi:HNH endonuclease [Vogesella facilis]|uniref:HNH endonuclease n=1 Tax=Vogesella facilis TaxID=1655232 RepID=A0ABV7RDB0_9NEIS
MTQSRINELFKRDGDTYLKSKRTPHAKWECVDHELIYKFELYNSPRDGLYFRILLSKSKLNRSLKSDLIELNSLKSGSDFVDYSITTPTFKETIKKIYTTLKSYTQESKADHLELLSWFEQYAGQVLTWEQLQTAPDTVTISAKGIYKPQSLPYALSIRQTLDSPYSDQEPEYQADGSWRYKYAQEEEKGGDSARLFTNQGLKRCMEDGVPVAVLRQLTKKPDVTRYRVMGLANVETWENGVFTLQSTTLASLDQEAEQRESESIGPTAPHSEFDPEGVEDTRKKTLREITKRQGQPAFRSGLLTAYEGRCAITDCAITQVLEAAHITPYLGPETNNIRNGLLLRSDLHTLWDKGMIFLDDAYTLRMLPSLASSEYATLDGKTIYLPNQEALRPSLAAIQAHRSWALKEH